MQNNWYKEAVVIASIKDISEALDVPDVDKASDIVVSCYTWLAGQNKDWQGNVLNANENYAIQAHCDPRLSTGYNDRVGRVITCMLGLQGLLDRGEVV